LAGTITVDKIQSDTSYNSTVNVVSALVVSNTATFANTTTHTGAATFANTLGVTGATTLSSTLAAGNTTITGTLATSGAATFSSTLAAGNTSITGFANISTTLAVGGNSSITGNLVVSGITTLTGNVSAGANVSAKALILDNAAIFSNTATVSNTTQNIIDSFPKANYSFGKLILTVKPSSGTERHATEILLLHDNTDVLITEYAQLFNTSLGSFDAGINNANVEIYFTSTSANASVTQTVKVIRQSS
jgi:hypothetical protein